MGSPTRPKYELSALLLVYGPHGRFQALLHVYKCEHIIGLRPDSFDQTSVTFKPPKVRSSAYGLTVRKERCRQR
ncbi:hypothetical protein VTK56DRAFT_2638 [Thermocarpiscus australiensis]